MSQTFDKKVKRRQYAHNNSISDNMGLQALNKKGRRSSAVLKILA